MPIQKEMLEREGREISWLLSFDERLDIIYWMKDVKGKAFLQNRNEH